MAQPPVTVPDQLDPLVNYATTNPETLSLILLGIVFTLFSYYRTRSLPLGKLPYRHLKAMFRDLGDTYFWVTRPRGVPGVVIPKPPNDVAVALVGADFESVDLYSYEYEDEVFNLRKPSGHMTHPKEGYPISMELHPRGFETSDGNTMILCHHEASRFEEPILHLNESVLSWERGHDELLEILDTLELTYESIESETESGIEIV